jgi:hypothetical protein
MSSRLALIFFLLMVSARPFGLVAPAPAQSSSSSSPSKSPNKHGKQPAAPLNSGIDPGEVSNGVYRNKALSLSCKVPTGWVFRTDEMNAPSEDAGNTSAAKGTAETAAGAKVLLAAFSRPPEARGEEVNRSIVIAAESVAAYPGLQEAVQYFGPLGEIAKAQGFVADDEPYEIALGRKTLVQQDFHKDVSSRVMRQSTLALLARGYAVSITVIGGTEDDVEELIDGIDFQVPAKVAHPPK